MMLLLTFSLLIDHRRRSITNRSQMTSKCGKLGQESGTESSR